MKNTPKNLDLNQATEKYTCQIFLPPKNPGIKNFKPPQNLWSSLSFKIQRTPLQLKSMEKLIPKGFVTLSFMGKNSRPTICEVPSVLQSVYTLWTQSSYLQSSGFTWTMQLMMWQIGQVNKCFSCKFLISCSICTILWMFIEKKTWRVQNVINFKCYDVSILCLSNFLEAIRHKNLILITDN